MPYAVYHAITPEVRTFYVHALGRIGPRAKAALPTLEEALNDDYPMVRAAAREAIRRIRGESR